MDGYFLDSPRMALGHKERLQYKTNGNCCEGLQDCYQVYGFQHLIHRL